MLRLPACAPLRLQRGPRASASASRRALHAPAAPPSPLSRHAAPPRRSRGPAIRPAPAQPARHAVRAAAAKPGGAEPLPQCFNLERCILLAGFAFEAYKDPVGGTRDADANGGATLYLSPFVAECFAGVLEVELQDASELAAGDITGQSDPYCVVSVGDSAWTSGVRRFTRAPVWRERARLFVRDVASATLRVRVLDEDLMKEDDTLGVAAVALAPLCDGGRHDLELPVQGGGAGPGGGVLRLAVRFRAFAAPARGLGAATPAAAPPALPPLLGAALDKVLPPKAAAAVSMVAGAAAALANAATDAVAAANAEAARRRFEKDLWAVPADDDWAILAAAPSAGATLPSEFEKVAFITHERTDTQVAVWRAPARRTLVVAFRGTETSRLRDIITDARLAPRAFNAERVGDAGADGAAVHDGFLDAFDSVRPRVLAAVDDARGAGPRARALLAASADASNNAADHAASVEEQQWHVFVTGHSLGGALATLFAAELAASAKGGGRRNVSVSMVNFGSPRVGNAAFVARYNQLVPDSVRVVNGSDAVPTVPALLGYRHVAHGVRITAAGEPSREQPPPALDSQPGLGAGIAQMAAAALGGGGGLFGGGVDSEAAAEAALALASLVDAAALEAHFEDKYLCALRAAMHVDAQASTRGE